MKVGTLGVAGIAAAVAAALIASAAATAASIVGDGGCEGTADEDHLELLNKRTETRDKRCSR